MDTYIKLLQEHRVSHLVCATEKAYGTEDLCRSGAKNYFPHTQLKCWGRLSISQSLFWDCWEERASEAKSLILRYSLKWEFYALLDTRRYLFVCL